MRKIYVRGMHAGDINGASPRLRYFRRKAYMPEQIVWRDYDGTLDSEILYIQKQSNYADLVIEAKNRGITVIYDSDDGDGIRRKGDDLPMFAVVDVITTDTQRRAMAFRRVTDTPVCVIEDGIDYIDVRPKPPKIKPFMLKACTFGSFRSTASAVPYMSDIKDLCQTSYITKKKIIGFEDIKFKSWNRTKIIRNLQKNDICIITHENNVEKPWKGNARLIVAMSIGLPTIAGNTPTHVEAMEACGCGQYIVDYPDEVLDKYEMLRDPGERLRVSKAFMDYAWKNYHPRELANKLATLIVNCVERGKTNEIYTDIQ